MYPKTYSFKNYPKNTNEKGIKKHINARHIYYYDALTNNTQRTVDECRIQNVGDNMTTTKTSKISLNMDVSNLDIPIRTNNKVPGKFKHELESRIIEALLRIIENL